jgi:hypothetical protein
MSMCNVCAQNVCTIRKDLWDTYPYTEKLEQLRWKLGELRYKTLMRNSTPITKRLFTDAVSKAPPEESRQASKKSTTTEDPKDENSALHRAEFQAFVHTFSSRSTIKASKSEHEEIPVADGGKYQPVDQEAWERLTSPQDMKRPQPLAYLPEIPLPSIEEAAREHLTHRIARPKQSPRGSKLDIVKAAIHGGVRENCQRCKVQIGDPCERCGAVVCPVCAGIQHCQMLGPPQSGAPPLVDWDELDEKGKLARLKLVGALTDLEVKMIDYSKEPVVDRLSVISPKGTLSNTKFRPRSFKHKFFR